ncbi:hypothetical protein VNO80_30021 [Phaseolus coccineus]|uniref:Uncharacterized protein n=1 Tax=Phaseolus coccineus TaxID=3886 RepID=A0AAN9LCG8_PHACN
MNFIFSQLLFCYPILSNKLLYSRYQAGKLADQAETVPLNLIRVMPAQGARIFLFLMLLQGVLYAIWTSEY